MKSRILHQSIFTFYSLSKNSIEHLTSSQTTWRSLALWVNDGKNEFGERLTFEVIIS